MNPEKKGYLPRVNIKIFNSRLFLRSKYDFLILNMGKLPPPPKKKKFFLNCEPTIGLIVIKNLAIVVNFWHRFWIGATFFSRMSILGTWGLCKPSRSQIFRFCNEKHYYFAYWIWILLHKVRTAPKVICECQILWKLVQQGVHNLRINFIFFFLQIFHPSTQRGLIFGRMFTRQKSPISTTRIAC